MEFPRERLEELIYGGHMGRRFTQDSPVLPDVWFEYSRRHGSFDLLLTPFAEAGPNHSTPGALSVALRARLEAERKKTPTAGFEPAKEPPRIAYNQSTVLARLRFDELIRVALPMSVWWSERVLNTRVIGEIDSPSEHEAMRTNATLVDAMNDPGKPPIGTPGSNYLEVDRNQKEAVRALREGLKQRNVRLTGDVLWMFRVVGTIAAVTRRCLEAREAEPPSSSPVKRKGRAPRPAAPKVASFDEWSPPDAPPEGVSRAQFEGHQERRKEFFRQAINARVDLLADLDSPGAPTRAKPARLIHSIGLNRTAQTSVMRSRVSVKADAATRVFDLSCHDLTWAVLDSGIEATHPAFRRRKTVDRVRPPTQGDVEDPDLYAEHRELYEEDEFKSRVIETYDFTGIESLLNLDDSDDQIKALREEIEVLEGARKAARRKRTRADATDTGQGVPEPEDVEDEDDEGEERMEALTQLKKSLQSGKDLDWELLIPLIRMPHKRGKYRSPRHDHGTHVAGILAGDWGEKVTGICPDLRLYDLRVLDDQGQGSEFNAIAALQFIRYLKGKRSFVGVQGVNLSLAIRHEVANYACGRTPICEECERLIGAGIVVVAAAGNEGYQQYVIPKGGVLDAYRGISITDPGNAEGVITVGSTHRFQPHTYGVSYFSSRGPTGDGRSKPDLVAPGEKIGGPVPDPELGVRLMDGTSMAAPHVSGAAALLIARHRELAGQPEKIKQILCETATDLGREKYFQGHGMVDILRALQSV